MVENHREFTRVKTAIPVTLVHPGGRIEALSKDISLNGLFARCESVLPAGTKVEVSLQLDAIRIEAHGSIIRALPGGMAVHFDELIEVDSYEHLRNLILYNAADPAQAEQEFDSHLGLKRVDPA